MIAAREGHRLLGPQPAHQGDLFLGPLAAVAEILAERFVLHRVPADPDAEAESPAAQQIDLRRLLGGQGGLALGQDDHSGDQFDGRGDGSQIAEHHQGLVEGGVHVVGPRPSGVHVRVSPHDVVVGEDVGETQFFDPLAVSAHRAGIAAQFRLGKHHTDPHIHTVSGP